MPSPSTFVWYELMTTDDAAAEAFYRDVVDWTAQDAGQPDMKYTLLLAAGQPAAGLMALPPEARAAGATPAWVGYVGVDDVDRYAGRVTAGGGRVHVPPTDIPGIGRFAMVGDPQGAAFSLFEAKGDDAPTVPADQAGRVGWHELYAEDAGQAFEFYAGLFGWSKAEAIDMGEMGRYQLFSAGGEPIGGMMTKPAEMPAPFWNYYFQVAGMGAALERLKGAGGTVLNGPMQVPGGRWIVQALDPQGAMFSLVSGVP